MVVPQQTHEVCDPKQAVVEQRKESVREPQTQHSDRQAKVAKVLGWDVV